MKRLTYVLLLAGMLAFVLGGCSTDVAGPNRAPVADAGPDRVINLNDALDLDGGRSYDPDGDSPLRYTWRLLAAPDGAAGELTDADQQVAHLAPDRPGIWMVELVVSDGQADSGPDVVKIRTLNVCEIDDDCDDHDVCTGDETCVNNACQPGETLDCDDQDPCTDDECDPVNGCYPVYNTAACDDQDACTMNDACSDGRCVGEPLDLDDDGHVSDQCGGDDCDDSRFEVNPEVFEGPWSAAACTDSADNDCDGDTDAADLGCLQCDNDDDCNDDNVCNGIERCIDTGCRSGTYLQCADTNPCTDDGCDPATGCTHEFNTAVCDDGNLCTLRDTCNGGACVGEAKATTTIAEGGCDDTNTCTDDSCNPADGTCAYQNNTAACDDADPCTLQDVCDGSGVCTGIPKIDVAVNLGGCNDGNLCTDDSCEAGTGACQHANNTLDCDDGYACTINDACSAGICAGENKVDVDEGSGGCNDGNSCTDDTCNPADGVCGHMDNTDVCDDGDLCTIQDVCSAGICAGLDKVTTPIALGGCNDGNVCTTASCNAGDGACQYSDNDGAVCTIGNCTGTCSGGECGGCVCDNAGDCDDGNDCTVDTCPSNVCVWTDASPGTSCDDGYPCTVQDQCNGTGSCVGVDKVTVTVANGGCNDENVCTDDSCNPANGNCGYVNNTDSCNDQDLCTLNDQCDGGICQGVDKTTLPVVSGGCDDDNVCTTDTCRSADGLCEYANNSLDCDDGDLCTVSDSCSGGFCDGVDKVTVPVGSGGCDDENVCTNDSCIPGDGSCNYQFNTATCEDGDLCTINDVCDGSGNCDGVDKVTIPEVSGGCDDEQVCTDDSCNPGTGACSHQNNTASCDDLDPCTMNDGCLGGTCAGDDRINIPESMGGCDDENDCTDNTCNSGTGNCGHPYNTAPCNDGLNCTVNDVCDGLGGCSGVDKTTVSVGMGGCDDENDCTNDTCEPADGSCGYTNNDGDDCDDADPCTIYDICVADACTGQDKVLVPEPDGCDDSNVCTDDSCNTGDGSCEYANNTAPCTDTDPCTINEQCSGGSCTGDDKVDVPVGEGGCDDEDECTTDSCLPGDGSCSYVENSGPCNDGFDCTDNDTCSAGTCAGSPLDEICEALHAGDICWTDCTVDASGCVDPPELSLSCEDPVTLPDNDSLCDLTLSNGTTDNQTGCLSCSAKAGIVTLDFTDFENTDGDCDIDGWTLVPGSGDQCPEAVDNCSWTGSRNCSDTFADLCDDYTFGSPVMRSDQATNDGGDEGWRIRKTFNASALTGMRVCFDYAEHNANNNEGVMVFIEGCGTPRTRVECIVDGPIDEQNDTFFRFCTNDPSYPFPGGPPAWPDNCDALTVEFLLHSNDNGQILWLDNIEVQGWSGGCPEDWAEVFSDDFADCSLTQWTTVSASVACPGEGRCQQAEDTSNDLWCEDTSWTITKTGINASELDDFVELCFDFGNDHGDSAGDNIVVEFSSDGGGSWQEAWSQDSRLGTNNECNHYCFNLSAIDPAVNNNPDLGIQFTLSSDNNDDELWLDNVSVKGARYCSVGNSIVDLTAIQEIGGGVYQFTAIDVQSEPPLNANIQCSWDPGVDVEAEDFVIFQE